MAVAQPAPGAGRHAFWATGITLYALWTLGTLAGALIGRGIDTSALGSTPPLRQSSWPCCGHSSAVTGAAPSRPGRPS